MEEGERNWDEKRGLKFYFICLVMPEFERPWTIFMRDAKIDEIRRILLRWYAIGSMYYGRISGL